MCKFDSFTPVPDLKSWNIYIKKKKNHHNHTKNDNYCNFKYYIHILCEIINIHFISIYINYDFCCISSTPNSFAPSKVCVLSYVCGYQTVSFRL